MASHNEPRWIAQFRDLANGVATEEGADISHAVVSLYQQMLGIREAYKAQVRELTRHVETADAIIDEVEEALTKRIREGATVDINSPLDLQLVSLTTARRWSRAVAQTLLGEIRDKLSTLGVPQEQLNAPEVPLTIEKAERVVIDELGPTKTELKLVPMLLR